jgi:pyridoxal phosphate enzyme (YggS family)
LAASGLAPDLPRWHAIGHIQRNKARLAAGAFVLLHAVDSWELGGKLDGAAAAAGVRQPVLIEVNVTREAQKYGAPLEEAPELAAHLGTLPHLDLQGLMAMARYGAEEAELHATFAALRRLAETARRTSGLPLPELSMGMSADFEIAVEEGATLVRVGTAIFGERG